MVFGSSRCQAPHPTTRWIAYLATQYPFLVHSPVRTTSSKQYNPNLFSTWDWFKLYGKVKPMLKAGKEQEEIDALHARIKELGMHFQNCTTFVFNFRRSFGKGRRTAKESKILPFYTPY
jgi:hypothetical protein